MLAAFPPRSVPGGQTGNKRQRWRGRLSRRPLPTSNRESLANRLLPRAWRSLLWPLHHLFKVGIWKEHSNAGRRRLVSERPESGEFSAPRWICGHTEHRMLSYALHVQEELWWDRRMPGNCWNQQWEIWRDVQFSGNHWTVLGQLISSRGNHDWYWDFKQYHP